jgi:2-iminobutanoate/2-iminopropanoate deaminase
VTGCAATPERAEQTPATRQCYHLHAAVEAKIGYCQAMRVDNRLYISGSVGQGEMPDAIRGAYGELATTLAAYGLGFGDVVKETVYTTNLDEFIKNKDIRKEFYRQGVYPTGSWVQVARLFTPAFKVEVEIEAVFPPGR